MMNLSRENSQAPTCSSSLMSDDGLSRLDILSSVANVDSLKDISSLEKLSQNEASVIELLNHYSKRKLQPSTEQHHKKRG
jgi:hypothetical protein